MSRTARSWFPDRETLELIRARDANKKTIAHAEGILQEAEEYKHYLERALSRNRRALILHQDNPGEASHQ
jgi:hypothetical protein